MLSQIVVRKMQDLEALGEERAFQVRGQIGAGVQEDERRRVAMAIVAVLSGNGICPKLLRRRIGGQWLLNKRRGVALNHGRAYPCVGQWVDQDETSGHAI